MCNRNRKVQVATDFGIQEQSAASTDTVAELSAWSCFRCVWPRMYHTGDDTGGPLCRPEPVIPGGTGLQRRAGVQTQPGGVIAVVLAVPVRCMATAQRAVEAVGDS